MRANRSMPRSTVIPVLVYPDVSQAVSWLCDAFGFTERLRIGTHRVQLNVGRGSVIVTGPPSGRGEEPLEAILQSHPSTITHSVMVRVEGVDAHFKRARERGATILEPPADYPYGERQYSAEDLGGHSWTFSQSIADVAPEDWGGVSVTPPRIGPTREGESQRPTQQPGSTPNCA